VTATVLILGDDHDAHSRVVAACLWRRHRLASQCWSFAQFPAERLSFVLENGGDYRSVGAELLELDRLHAIWWRRPGIPVVSEEIRDERVRRYARAEAEHFLTGIFQSLGVPIVNDPHRQHAASRKPLQLKVAADVGLKVPRTLLSNDPEQIRAFWSDLEGRCIYKAFASPSWIAVETRRMTAEDVKSLASAALSPIIVQEEVERSCDVRVNIFGDELFACCVEPRHAVAEIDSRFDITAVWEPCELPDEIKRALFRLMATLGLDYGCIDLRQDPSGELVFFEINPAGQFLFAEVDTAQPLSDAMARLLAEGSVNQSPLVTGPPLSG
jgi:glutathione synthase/RimK-type ligase-like ATP-grasp enzyme